MRRGLLRPRGRRPDIDYRGFVAAAKSRTTHGVRLPSQHIDLRSSLAARRACAMSPSTPLTRARVVRGPACGPTTAWPAVEVCTREGLQVVDTDEHPRSQTSLESLHRLKPFCCPATHGHRDGRQRELSERCGTDVPDNRASKPRPFAAQPLCALLQVGVHGPGISSEPMSTARASDRSKPEPASSASLPATMPSTGLLWTWPRCAAAAKVWLKNCRLSRRIEFATLNVHINYTVCALDHRRKPERAAAHCNRTSTISSLLPP